MTQPNDEYKKNKPQAFLMDADAESGDQSSGGQSGNIEFSNFISMGGETRDDLLTNDDKRRLLASHQDSNEAKVKQQKEKREQYKDLKNGKTSLQAFRQGMQQSIQANFKANPVLADKAQFSGGENRNSLPSEDTALTNEEMRDKLVNALRYQPKPTPQPTFNPKPRGPY